MVWSEKAQKLGNINANLISKENAKKRRSEYSKNPKICKREICNNIISYESRKRQIFCSHTCSASVNNKNNRKSSILFCKKCDEELECGKKDMCSKECKDKFRFKDLEQKIIHGEVNKRSTIKKYFLEKYGHQCWICKLTEWMGKPIPLQLDHIDGNNKNNVLTNCRLLCVNCHAQTFSWRKKEICRK